MEKNKIKTVPSMADNSREGKLIGCTLYARQVAMAVTELGARRLKTRAVRFQRTDKASTV